MSQKFDKDNYKLEYDGSDKFLYFRTNLVENVADAFADIHEDITAIYEDLENKITENEIPEVTPESIGAATVDHNHTDVYATKEHNHDEVYSKDNHSHDYSSLNNIPEKFVPSTHAEAHAADGTDPITPSSIGALGENKNIDMKYKYEINNVSSIDFGTVDSDDFDTPILTIQPVLDTDNNLVAIDFKDEYTGIEGQGVCLQNVAMPINNSDAANKSYVDNKILYSTSAPTEDDGEDGSIWIVYS